MMRSASSGESGATLVEMLVALAIFGAFALISLEIVTRGDSLARGSQRRHHAESVVRQSKSLFMIRNDQASIRQMHPGNPRSDFRKTFTIQRGDGSVTFETACQRIPKQLEALASTLPSILLAENKKSLGSLCDVKDKAALRCPPNHRPVLRITHMQKGAGTAKSSNSRVVEHPPAAASDGSFGSIAGGFCMMRSGAMEYKVAFNQVIRDGERIVHIKSDVLLPIDSANPYGAGANRGLVFLSPAQGK